MPKIIHFEIAIDNPDRAIKFYQSAFNWKISRWGGPADYWLINAGEESEPGINGALQRRKDAPQSVITIVSVPSIDKTLDKIKKAGGEITAPKMPVPGVGWAAYCKDTEGNIIGILQEDPSAK
ncbi:MAG: VOC family protein [Promethearchaeota archaeon]